MSLGPRTLGVAAILLIAATSACDDDPVRPAPVDIAGTWHQVAGPYLLEPEMDTRRSDPPSCSTSAPRPRGPPICA